MHNTVRGYEIWVYHFEPENKRQSKDFGHKNKLYRKNSRPQRLAAKSFSHYTRTLKAQCSHNPRLLAHPLTLSEYCESRGKLKARLRRVRLHTEQLLLQRDKARPHTNARTTTEISCLSFTVLYHPPRSRKLAPSDFHFFPSSRNTLEDITLRQPMHLFHHQGAKFYPYGLMKLLERRLKCVDREYDYVET